MWAWTQVLNDDSTAVVAVSFNRQTQHVPLVWHRVFQPSPDDPLDFEATIEAALLELHGNFHVVKVLFDPYQMMGTSQRLARAGLPIEEFPQTPANLTAASQNLFELITGRNLRLYADPGMRLAASRAVALETSRGWRISKEKQAHKIDSIIALAMAAHAAVGSQHFSFAEACTPELTAEIIEGSRAYAFAQRLHPPSIETRRERARRPLIY